MALIYTYIYRIRDIYYDAALLSGIYVICMNSLSVALNQWPK